MPDPLIGVLAAPDWLLVLRIRVVGIGVRGSRDGARVDWIGKGCWQLARDKSRIDGGVMEVIDWGLGWDLFG